MVNINDLLDRRKDPFNMGVTLPEGHVIVEDEELLRDYTTGKSLVVELGTFKGRASSLMSLFAKKVITIDLYHPEQDHGGFKNNKKSLKKFKNLEVRKNDGYKEAIAFKDSSIDVLFVDAGHDFERVQRDFNCYWGKVKVDGLFIFHDYLHQPSVQEAVDDLLETETAISLVEKKGWCCVVKKLSKEALIGDYPC